MASFTITGSSTIGRTLAGGESGVIAPANASLIVPGGVAVQMTNSTSIVVNHLLVNGTLIASGTSTVDKAVTSIGNSASIGIGPDGYVGSAAGYTFDLGGSAFVDFTNAGTVLSNSNVAVRIAPNASFLNVFFSNSGTILGDTATWLDSGTASAWLVNSGIIQGRNGAGMLANTAGTSTGTSYLKNSGTIAGNTISYGGGDGVNIVYNAGTMLGTVDLDGGPDRYEGGPGSVIGLISGEDGNDTIAGGAASDSISGGADADTLLGRGGDDDIAGDAGSDLLLGGDGNDAMDGGTEADTLNGNAGDDTLLGNAGEDLLVGQDGSDSLDGGADNDTMDGGAGNDILEGGSGNDILRGREGEDDLAGGLGLDLLTGGQGADSFVFRALSETAVGALRDQILDFEQGVDLIVVAGLSPGVFEFRGTAAFAPSGNPELRLFETPTGSTIVQFDADGNGSIDAEIRVANVTGLTAEDFVL
ncbi:calcium-binding protein [Maliponia aquimaris]|uniref:Hemolysin, chromosomal n=1 Tax=Maliponia aquimaris TaxID=1673631 RepID=A0A238KSA2_9RHOB|nr:calcium-binding protein [Maliponia aquimaris]SMX45598.1 Hemolysin, chromosomal [Maliponia aquimaris]